MKFLVILLMGASLSVQANTDDYYGLSTGEDNIIPTTRSRTVIRIGGRTPLSQRTTTTDYYAPAFAKIGTPIIQPTLAEKEDVQVAEIPEPSILALMGLGLIGMFVARRKQK